MRALPPLLLLLPAIFSGCDRAPRSSGPLRQEAYVWQRTHTPAVVEAIRVRSASFHSLVVLAAEISWTKSGASFAPQIARVPLDWSALQSAPRLGLALRINPYPGPFARDDATADTLAALTRTVLAEAAAHHLAVAELQIDFDAATAKLPGYLVWINRLRATAAPVPLTFTALPAWLRSPEFSALARTAPGYVLQVHSLPRPHDADETVTLCDPSAARAALERAARLGVPFRVALPTYGYTLAYDAAGRYVGQTEGPRPGRREGVTEREVAANSAELAALVRALTAEHPAVLTGLIWYRLPVAGEQLNWSWPNLAAVMAGRSPAPRLHAAAQSRGEGLFDVTLSNDGDGDYNGPANVAIRWHDAARTAAEALAPFATAAETATSLQLAAPVCALPAGTRRAAGWLRLSDSAAIPAVAVGQ